MTNLMGAWYSFKTRQIQIRISTRGYRYGYEFISTVSLLTTSNWSLHPLTSMLEMHLLVPAPARAKDRRGFGSIIGAGTGTDRGICRPRDAKLLPGRGSGSRFGYAAAYLSLGVPLGVRSCTFDRAAQDLALFLKMSGGGPLSLHILSMFGPFHSIHGPRQIPHTYLSQSFQHLLSKKKTFNRQELDW
jgi:hypothetical protein